MHKFQNAYTALLLARERYEKLRNRNADLDEVFSAKGDLHRARNEVMYARRAYQAGR